MVIALKMRTATFFGILFSFAFSYAASVEREADFHIPVIDMRDFSTEKREQMIATLYEAMTTTGFFAVTHTGVNTDVIKKAYQEAETFFKSAPEVKAACTNKQNSQRGFVPGETAKGHRAKDFKEFYHIGRELPPEELERLGLQPNVWPEQPEFKEAMLQLVRELDQYVVPLQEAVVAAINRGCEAKISSNYFNERTKEGDVLFRALYYPALSLEQIKNMEAPLYWAAAHTDIDYLAIIPRATARGLQVEYQGKWHNVVVPEDAFVVNVGDFLTNLTNGLFVSSRHRVQALDPDTDRFSMVLFVHPTSETSLAPLPGCIEQTGGVQRYASGTRKEFLWERLLELGIAPALLEPYSKTGHVERQMKLGRASPQVVEQLVEAGLASEELIQAMKK